MKWARTGGLFLAMSLLTIPALAAPDPGIENLALCRESWLDWKNSDPAKLDRYSALLRSDFTQEGNSAAFRPKSVTTVAGLTVSRVFPESLGSGVGFSVLVDASFDKARQAIEHELRKPLRDCETSDGMRTCELTIGEQRTVVLASGDPNSDNTALVGCYYLYEK